MGMLLRLKDILLGLEDILLYSKEPWLGMPGSLPGAGETLLQGGEAPPYPSQAGRSSL